MIPVKRDHQLILRSMIWSQADWPEMCALKHPHLLFALGKLSKNCTLSFRQMGIDVEKERHLLLGHPGSSIHSSMHHDPAR
jgi:hypothetical protein